ncbi:type II secretion system GspH family protein [Halanaerobium sp. Z-7514]|uniref:Type II secretion system GspH family protein n=1 Tax=Halanaerobium polyolivorans TaxID=2886943 RepID=A0AAW4WVI0_9FIRM|nr:type II secretion system protein [Halanaerobium polyolivorans]MCC3143723.1 type II secretion system GspH family protein [Halanaerobium polyolivorans]
MSIFKSNKGFTLIEIVLAIAIVGILGVSVMAYFGNAARFIRETDVREQAVLISQQEMERVKGLDFDNIVDETVIYDSDGAYPEYTVNITTINEVNGQTGLKEITVTTTWDNETKSASLISYIAER